MRLHPFGRKKYFVFYIVKFLYFVKDPIFVVLSPLFCLTPSIDTEYIVPQLQTLHIF